MGHFTFLALPFELQGQILTNALVAPAQILVWSSEIHWWMSEARADGSRLKHYNLTQRYNPDPGGKYISSKHDLAIGLFQVNRALADRTTRWFYSQNTFLFSRYSNLDVLISWLRGIARNRSSFTSVTVWLRDVSALFGKSIS